MDFSIQTSLELGMEFIGRLGMVGSSRIGTKMIINIIELTSLKELKVIYQVAQQLRNDISAKID